MPLHKSYPLLDLHLLHVRMYMTVLHFDIIYSDRVYSIN